MVIAIFHLIGEDILVELAPYHFLSPNDLKDIDNACWGLLTSQKETIRRCVPSDGCTQHHP